MSRAFSFFIGDEEIQKSLDFDQLNRLPNNIRDLLFQNGKYSIQSNVSFQNLSSFLDYYFDESKNPDINIDNIYEYRFLSKEFNFNTDYLSSPEVDKFFKISALLKTKEEEISDKSIFEEYISQNLDYYLDNYSQEMHKIPVSTLYNIFFNESRILNDHEKAYQFIISGDENLYVLIQSLDSTKLSEQALKDAISNNDTHLGFIPKNSFSFIDSFKEQFSLLNNDLHQTMEEFKKQIREDQKQHGQIVDELKSKIESLQKDVNSLYECCN